MPQLKSPLPTGSSKFLSTQARQIKFSRETGQQICCCPVSFEFDLNSGDAVLLLIRSCRCDGFHNTVHRLFGPYVTKLIWRTCQG